LHKVQTHPEQTKHTPSVEASGGVPVQQGCTSVVYKAYCSVSHTTVCLKVYSLSQMCVLDRRQVDREIQIHSSLSHVNIIKLYGAFRDEDRVVLVQEFASHGDLFSQLRNHGCLPEHAAANHVLIPFLAAMQYLHDNGIAHRGVQSKNIVFCFKGLKLCDFSLAISLHAEKAVTRVGSLEFMAPEMLNCPSKSKPEENAGNPSPQYSFPVDLWAAGVLTYEMLVGMLPFSAASLNLLEKKIRLAEPLLPINLSEVAKDFIAQALTKNPKDRPKIWGLINHPWINPMRSFGQKRPLPQLAQQHLRAQEVLRSQSVHISTDSNLNVLSSNLDPHSPNMVPPSPLLSIRAVKVNAHFSRLTTCLGTDSGQPSYISTQGTVQHSSTLLALHAIPALTPAVMGDQRSALPAHEPPRAVAAGALSAHREMSGAIPAAFDMWKWQW